MFEDGDSGWVLPEITHQCQCSIDIKVVIVAQGLAVEAVEEGLLIPVDCRLLMRVFTIPQRAGLPETGGPLFRYTLHTGQVVKIVTDRCIVVGSVSESIACQIPAQFKRHCAVLLQLLLERSVLIRRGDHTDMCKVLCSSTQHGGSANVDILRCDSRGDLRTTDRLFEGVEVHDDQFEGADIQFFNLPEILLVAGSGQHTAMNRWMERLDTSVHE